MHEKQTQRPLKRVAYRPREVAEMVGMSESGVRNLIRRGTLRAVQLDGRWLIPATVIEDKLGVQLDASTAAGVAPKAEQSPMLHAAAVKGLTMAEVLHWLDTREDQEVKDILAATGVPAALDARESSQSRTDRAVDSLYATAEEVLHVYGNARVAAFTEGHSLDLDYFLSGDHTIYLYAPAHQQRLLRPLFETVTQQVVAAAQEKAATSPDGMLSPRLGLFLDEVGNCAALSELDVLATTARGQGIQLVTVWHDKSQLEARYGPKASTILNNHRANLFLSGLADLSALELGARLIGDRQTLERARSLGSDGRHSLNESVGWRPLLPVEDLRRLRPGGGGVGLRAPAPHPDPPAPLLHPRRAAPPRPARGPRRTPTGLATRTVRSCGAGRCGRWSPTAAPPAPPAAPAQRPAPPSPSGSPTAPP